MMDYGAPVGYRIAAKHPERAASLIVWGKNDDIFPEEGAHPYKRDLKNIEFHLLDTGHFALEEDGDKIAYLITCFMAKHTDFLSQQPEYRETCALAA